MLFSFALLSFLAPATINATAATRRPPCSAPPPKKEFLDTLHEFRVQEANATASALVERATAQINTYVHIIASDTTARGGYVSASLVNQQMRVLNDNYKNTGFSFVLQDIDYIVNPRYARLQDNGDEYRLKEYLRKGNYRELNLYYFVSMYTGNTGWCYYPTRVSPGSYDFYLDGCVLHQGTLPGGSYAPWNEGKITSHEVGHWSGLIHPFEGSCNDGDLVDDTPAEASAAYGCPVGRDTCNQPGQDPIHNYMDYTDNSCQNEFTRGQISRMWSSWNAYRA